MYVSWFQILSPKLPNPRPQPQHKGSYRSPFQAVATTPLSLQSDKIVPTDACGLRSWGGSSQLHSLEPSVSKPRLLAGKVYAPETEPKPACRLPFLVAHTRVSDTHLSCLESHVLGLGKAEAQEAVEGTLALSRSGYRFLS